VILKFARQEVRPGLSTLVITGNIHCGPECARLEREVDELIASRQTSVVFDMTGCTHMDSAAIGSIVRCVVKLKKAGGGLHLAAAQPMILYSLQLTKVDKLIGLFPTLQQAVAAFPAQSSAPS